MKRKFLGLFLLPKPKFEHRRLVDVIRSIAGSEYKQIFVSGPTIAFLFMADIPASKMGFSTVLLNGDSHLIVEVGESFAHEGLGIAGDWLWKHRQMQ